MNCKHGCLPFVYLRLSIGGDSRKFQFWDVRKLSWVKWDALCLHRKNGGLDVGRLKEFNFSLLGRWVWRMLKERGSSCYNVLCAKYGEEGGDYVLVEEGVPCGGKT